MDNLSISTTNDQLYNFVPEGCQRYLFEFNKYTKVPNPISDEPSCSIQMNERNDESFESRSTNSRALCTRPIKYSSHPEKRTF
jgi:hypothetical protein